MGNPSSPVFEAMGSTTSMDLEEGPWGSYSSLYADLADNRLLSRL